MRHALQPFLLPPPTPSLSLWCIQTSKPGFITLTYLFEAYLDHFTTNFFLPISPYNQPYHPLCATHPPTLPLTPANPFTIPLVYTDK